MQRAWDFPVLMKRGVQINVVLGQGTWRRKLIVIGILPTADDVASRLNNLAEAEFAPEDTSLIMRSRADVEKLAALSGMMNGLSPDALLAKLSDLGLSSQDARLYSDAALAGSGVVAVAAPAGSEDAAAEIMTDSNGRDVRMIKEN